MNYSIKKLKFAKVIYWPSYLKKVSNIMIRFIIETPWDCHSENDTLLYNLVFSRVF